MTDTFLQWALNPTPELTAENTYKLISHEELQVAITSLGVRINASYREMFRESGGEQKKNEVAFIQDVVVLCVMSGGMIFCSHLLPLLDFPLRFDSLQTSRYGDKDKGGELRWLKKPDVKLHNKHVLIVEDMIDEGVSLKAIYDYCESENTASTKVAVLLDKNTPRRVASAVVPDFIGMAIPDEFIFGFGIDYKNYYRNLLDVYSVKL